MEYLKIGLLILVIIVISIVLIRLYNDYKYSHRELTTKQTYYSEVTNIDLYPKMIDGVDLTYVDSGACQGFHMTPHNRLYSGVVVCYGGSEGSPNFKEAERLAKAGYETLAVFMFGMKNQPKTLVRVPLEQFEDVLQYINKTIKDKTPITVLGASKGAEYALNLATKYKEISNLILIAPSAYTFAGLDFNHYGSSFTYKNKEIPYIDIKKASSMVFIKNMAIPIIIKSPVQYKDGYSNAVKKDTAKDLKLIPVKDIQANILMIVGEDDQMWDSYGMAKRIKSQNDRAMMVSYKYAGHIFDGDGILNTSGLRVKTGGSLKANQEASEESNKVMDAFLNRYHPQI